MLILSRKTNQKIIIDGGIEIMIVEIRGDKVRVGIKAPSGVAVHREEIAERIKAEGKKAAGN